MKEILITNDDGFEAQGLLELRKALSSIANITVVAPSSEKSACSHSITCNKPLRFIILDDGFFKLDDATPSDCVYLALHKLYNKKPDLVISGINRGANVAEDITYSGTCGGAMEAVLQGIPAVAISQLYVSDSLDKYGYSLACEITLDIVNKIFSNGYPLPKKQFLNINVPCISKKDYKGMKVVQAGEKSYSTDAQTFRSPRGFEYYWLGEGNLNFDKSKNINTDIEVLHEGYASITPLMLNLTAKENMEKIEKWIL